MQMNYSKDTYSSVIEVYEYRVEALKKENEFLKAQLEVSKQINYNKF